MSEVESFLRHPVTYVTGGIASVIAVIATLGLDPVSSVAVLSSVIAAHATSLFTATSIFGFTVAPMIEAVPATPFKVAAVFFGSVVALIIINRVWESIEESVLG